MSTTGLAPKRKRRGLSQKPEARKRLASKRKRRGLSRKPEAGTGIQVDQLRRWRFGGKTGKSDQDGADAA